MILLQRPTTTHRSWETIVTLPLWLGTGQHHASTLYVCRLCGNAAWRRLIEPNDTTFNIEHHDCHLCGGYFPIVDSDFEGLRYGATYEMKAGLGLLALAHPAPTYRSYLHHYQETRRHD